MHTHTWFNRHIAQENKSINILLLKSSADLPGSQQLLGRPLGHGRLGLASPGTQWLGSGAAMRLRFCQLGVRGTTGADLTNFVVKNMRKTSELRCENKTFWGNIFYFGNTHRKAGTLAPGAVGVLQLPSDLSKVQKLNPQSSPRVCLELLAPV